MDPWTVTPASSLRNGVADLVAGEVGPVGDEAVVADEAGLAVEVQRRSSSCKPMTSSSLNSSSANSKSAVRARPSPTASTAARLRIPVRGAAR